MSGENFKENLFYYLLTECIISFVLCIPAAIFMRSKPEVPPSISQKDHEKPKFIESIKILYSNRNFVFLSLAFAFIIGFFNVIGTKVNSIFVKYNVIDANQISLIAAVANVAGIIGSIVMSLIVDKYKKYKLIFILLAFVGFLSQLLITVLCEIITDSSLFFVVLLLLFSMTMFSIVPVFTISYDLVIELTYPVGESISGGIIMTSSQISGIIAIFIVDYFIANNLPRYTSCIICLIMLFIAFVSLFFMKEELLRLKKDNNENENEQLNA